MRTRLKKITVKKTENPTRRIINPNYKACYGGKRKMENINYFAQIIRRSSNPRIEYERIKFFHKTRMSFAKAESKE